MKQKKLVKKLLQACLINDNETINELRVKEFKKIFNHKEKNKQFSTRWTIVRL